MGSDAEGWDVADFVGNDGARNEIPHALKLRVHEHGDGAKEVEGGEEVGNAKQISNGARLKMKIRMPITISDMSWVTIPKTPATTDASRMIK